MDGDRDAPLPLPVGVEPVAWRVKVDSTGLSHYYAIKGDAEAMKWQYLGYAEITPLYAAPPPIGDRLDGLDLDAVFSMEPDLGASTPEPSLSHMIWAYYHGYLSDFKASEVAKAYRLKLIRALKGETNA